jgi:hypothetical protein
MCHLQTRWVQSFGVHELLVNEVDTERGARTLPVNEVGTERGVHLLPVNEVGTERGPTRYL